MKNEKLEKELQEEQKREELLRKKKESLQRQKELQEEIKKLSPEVSPSYLSQVSSYFKNLNLFNRVSQPQPQPQSQKKEQIDNRLKDDSLCEVRMIGQPAVGKSCLVLRFCDDIYTESYISTIGVDFKCRTIEVDNRTIKLKIWDTAGQERFRTTRGQNYSAPNAYVLVVDITDKSSLDEGVNFLKEELPYANYGNPRCIMILGNKSDDTTKIVVTENDLKELVEKAKKLYSGRNCSFFYEYVSAKTGKGVEEAFMRLGNEFINSCSNCQIDEERQRINSQIEKLVNDRIDGPLALMRHLKREATQLEHEGTFGKTPSYIQQLMQLKFSEFCDRTNIAEFNSIINEAHKILKNAIEKCSWLDKGLRSNKLQTFYETWYKKLGEYLEKAPKFAPQLSNNINNKVN